jgi:hypothetical protein
MTWKKRIGYPGLGLGVMTLGLGLWGGSVGAQSSLPFDTELTPDESDTEATEFVVDGEVIIPPEDVMEVTPLAPPGPLKPEEDAIEDAPLEDAAGESTPPPEEDGLPALAEPLPEAVPDRPPAATGPVEDLPDLLMGQDADQAISVLEQDGWMVITRTPRLVQLDRGQLGLDITVNSTTGIVEDVTLIDLT